MNIQFRLVPADELPASSRAQMFQLFREHFDGVSMGQFEVDLKEKNLALLLERDGALVGFSTLRAYASNFDGEPINVIYSGDTIIAPDAWGSTALPRAWVAAVEALRATLPPARCFWMLLTSGFRTYRFLPVFWREFFPRFDAPTPPATQRMLDQFARERFGPLFKDGIVRFANSQRLRPALLHIPEGRNRDPHIAFFLASNPGHALGDELVAIAEIAPANLTPAGRRVTRSHAF